MKKGLLILLPLLALTGVNFGICSTCNIAKAEGEETPIIEPATPETPEGQPITEAEFTEKVKTWLSQYMDSNMVANIITWATTAGVLVALFGVYLKYKKYANKTIGDIIEFFKAEVGKHLGECFKDLDKEVINKIIKSIIDVNNNVQLLIEALALAQDKTPQGKIAMLELLQKNANIKEVVEAIEVVKEKVTEEIKKVEEIKKEVEGKYNPID